MKVFLWKEKQIFEINRKEEIDDNTYLISDYEEEMIEKTQEANGYLWIEKGEIKWSGPAPDNTYDWDDSSKKWVQNSERFAVKLKANQDQMWTAIKNERTKHIMNKPVYIESADKYFQTDEKSQIQYAQIGSMIVLDNYEPIQWKTADNSWVELTADLFKEVQTALTVQTQLHFKIAELHKAKMLQAEDPLKYDEYLRWADILTQEQS